MGDIQEVRRVIEVANKARTRRARTIPLTVERISENRRLLIGYLVTWETLCPGVGEDGYRWNVFHRDTFQDLGQAARNKEIRLVTAHLDELDWGHWGGFDIDSRGLKALAIPDEGPCFRLVEELFHSGELTHLSFRADVGKEVERSRPGPNGWPIYDILSARLNEAGPVDAPADPGAEILTIGGREARWRATFHRQQVMSHLRPVPRIWVEGR
jgi:hypothetical protein